MSMSDPVEGAFGRRIDQESLVSGRQAGTQRLFCGDGNKKRTVVWLVLFTLTRVGGTEGRQS